MSYKWFDFDEELSQNRDSFEVLKKNFGFTSRKSESERKLKSWSSVNKVSDIFDLDSRTIKDKLWNTVINDRIAGKTKFREHDRVSDDELLTELSDSARKMRDRFSRGFDSDIPDRRGRKDSASCSSTYSYPDGDHIYSRASSCQGNVTFPESSTASVNSDAASEKSFGRSISVNSEESVCTEKSADCSTVCETLPDGTNKTQFENNETWLAKSMSGSVCEKKVKDSTVTEKNDDRLCDKTTKKTSYIERSATGSSLQEESTSERVVSCDKSGKKTVQQKTSSETYKKAYRSPKTSSTSFYDELDACSYRGRQQNYRKSVDGSEKTVTEKISKLIDEAVHEDHIFRLSSDLEERMKYDFAEKGHFARERRQHGRRRPSGLFSEYGKGDDDGNWSKLKDLETENEALIQENAKLQSIIQNVSGVNKRRQDTSDVRIKNVQQMYSKLDNILEDINWIRCQFTCKRAPIDEIDQLEVNVRRLDEEWMSHVACLNEQLTSHKNELEAERMEKEKVIREMKELEKKVQELTREEKALRNELEEEKALRKALTEEKRKLLCGTCKGKVDKAAVFPGNEFFPANASYMPPNFHVSYNTNGPPPDKNYFQDEYHSKKGMNDKRTSYFSSVGDSYMSERFSECSIKTSGETIVVEDENGMRLSITEQFPSQLKSILKKNDKKIKTGEQTEKKKSGRNRKSSACEAVSIGFEKDGLARVTSFSPDAIPDKYVHPNTEFLKVGTDVRSKSEPNTRSNSSENLKPLRESSSWNNQCPVCDTSYVTEFLHNRSNQF